MKFKLAVKENKKLEQVIARVEGDAELNQLWKCANMNAVDRAHISDHGEIHIRIVAHAALRILRLLVEKGIQPSIVKDHKMTVEDAEVVVFLGACLHDLGISIHRDDHEQYSLFLAYPKARQLLAGIYDEPGLTTVVAETLHAVIAHNSDQRCLTIEAGVLKVADAVDMSEGRSRIPFEAGQVNIHSVSAQAIKEVKIEVGKERPIRLSITLNNSAGIFQVDELLKRKLHNSTLEPYVELVAQIHNEPERSIVEEYRL
ncbi:MAG TPA: HD domain-containing protein [Kiritimatiellia bacterium]|mgnify:CR=1 FL=1|nr:HD domain-containing protein [Kiritimatiellia bacterium]